MPSEDITRTLKESYDRRNLKAPKKPKTPKGSKL